MKKGVYFMTLALALGFSVLTTSCGGSKDDTAKADSLRADSISKDSVAKVERAKFVADSIVMADKAKALADSAEAAAAKGGKKGK